MTTVLLVGAGAVGARAARQLLDTAGVDRVLVADRRRASASALVAALGSGAVIHDAETPPPSGTDVVACAVPSAAAPDVVLQAIGARVPVVCVADAHASLRELAGLDAAATRAGVAVVTGAGLAPGLADVLARHAAALFDHADEVHVARAGVTGPASEATVRQELADRALEWRDGVLAPVPRTAGPAIVWFPEPVGAVECEPASAGVELLAGAVPGVRWATYRLAPPPRRRLVGRSTLAEGWGAVRVEVWGRRGQARESVVYGAIERTAVAVGTVLAVGAASLAGVLVGPVQASAGVRPLGAVVDPVPFLAELARRGVKAAAFEGVSAV